MKTKLLTYLLLFICLKSINGRTINNSKCCTLSNSTDQLFYSIEVKNSANVFITQGEEVTATVEEVEGEPYPDIRLTTKNRILTIDSEKNSKNDKPANVYITVKDLKKITLSGAGNITITNEIKSDQLEIINLGTGKINAVVNSKILKIKSSGSGDVSIAGKTNRSEIKMSGSGNLEAKNLKASICIVASTGSGNSTVDAEDDLTINITGSGNVYVVEYPEKMYGKSNGAGKVELLKA